MHLTREADYAIRIMYTLAVNHELTDAQTIADSIAVSKRYTLKILGKLTEAGLASSKLGAGGGYYLANPQMKYRLQIFSKQLKVRSRSVHVFRAIIPASVSAIA